MIKQKRIYFDHSASTPVDKNILKKMLPFFCDNFGNPSSIHYYGQKAIEAVDMARTQAAKFLNCNESEIIFTSGATEADNLAIFGLINALEEKHPGEKFHVITSMIEHDAVLEPCKKLANKGYEVTYIKPNSKGEVKIEDIAKEIKNNTVLISIMFVNSEVGSVQPVWKIGKVIEREREKREKAWRERKTNEIKQKPLPLYFHTDATQAANFFDCDVSRSRADLLSLSGHKIYGPKGVGLLYIRQGVSILPLQLGGHHERSLRSGTLNVPGIVGLGAALNQINEKYREKNNKYISDLRNFLIAGINKKIKNAILNTNTENSSPSHAHFSFVGAEGESVLISLDLENIAVSTGSACASGSLEPSHVLMAMGIKKEICHNSIRFTLGKHNKKEEILKLIKILPRIIDRLRKMSPEKDF